MNKFNQFFAEHGMKVLCVLLVLTYFRACSTSRSVARVDDNIEIVDKKIEDIRKDFENRIISAPEMIDIIKNTPAWRTLEIEELSDKNRIPINSFKNKEEN
jgi:hypothetical protein